MKEATSSEETYDVKKKQPLLMKHMRRKREKKVASEVAYCIPLKKRQYIQNTKYLKAKKGNM